ncbi:hypothetical protein OG275_21240 [Streptomyces niveus]|uniref:hypothetical protein n=1 Tax=Streptomyces niveus TaxID=193462 RepID=UPI002E314244|nr:hypothetical protein [Streptomyces niveus]
MIKLPDATLHRLNTEVLEAGGWLPFGGMFDMIEEWPASLPTKIGVYVFLIGGNEPITYPVGESSIVYFGKAEQQRGVRGRVSQHRGTIMRGSRGRWPGHAAHEWLMARGGFCMYSLAPDHDPFSSAWVERELIHAFQRLHRTRPVGNGTAA